MPINEAGTGIEHFLLKSKFKSAYLFTREEPKSWRKRIAAGSLYSLSEIESILTEVDVDTEVAEYLLTKTLEFDRIEVSG